MKKETAKTISEAKEKIDDLEYALNEIRFGCYLTIYIAHKCDSIRIPECLYDCLMRSLKCSMNAEKKKFDEYMNDSRSGVFSKKRSKSKGK